MAGGPEEGKGLRRLHNLSRVHHIDIVAQLGHHPHVVGDEKDGRAVVPAQVPHQPENLGLDGHVQGGGGLVGNEELRLTGHGHGDHHPLAQTPGQLPGIGVIPGRRVRDAHLLEELHGAGLGRPAVQAPVEAEDLRHLPAHRVHRVQRGHRVLEDHGDPVAPEFPQRPLPQGPQVRLSKADLPGGNPAGGGDQAQHGQGGHALAAAGLPHQPHDTPPGDGQVNAVHCGKRPLRGEKLRPQAGDGQGILSRFHRVPSSAWILT